MEHMEREGFNRRGSRRPYVSYRISDRCRSCEHFWFSVLHLESRCFMSTNEWPASQLTAHAYGGCASTHEARCPEWSAACG